MRSPEVGALLAATLALACAPPRSTRPDAPPPPRLSPVSTPTAPISSLAEAAALHLASVAPADRPLVLYLSLASGDGTAALAQQLREALAARLRVTFAAAAIRPGEPVPTTAPGEHAHAVVAAVTPWPDRVVRVSASGATSSIAVRLTGSDPLGPAEAGWEWFQTRP